MTLDRVKAENKKATGTFLMWLALPFILVPPVALILLLVGFLLNASASKELAAIYEEETKIAWEKSNREREEMKKAGLLR